MLTLTKHKVTLMNTTSREDLVARIEKVIDQIRPYLQADGGNIRFVHFTDDNIVNVELLGACGSCPMSQMTLKAGVEQAIKKVVPEVKSVEAIN